MGCFCGRQIQPVFVTLAEVGMAGSLRMEPSPFVSISGSLDWFFGVSFDGVIAAFGRCVIMFLDSSSFLKCTFPSLCLSFSLVVNNSRVALFEGATRRSDCRG